MLVKKLFTIFTHNYAITVNSLLTIDLNLRVTKSKRLILSRREINWI